MKNFTLFLLVALFLGSCGSMCRAANLTITNKGDVKINLAIAYYAKHKPKSDSGNGYKLAVVTDSSDSQIVEGWFQMQPGATRTFNKHDGVFAICYSSDGNEGSVDGLEKEQYWIHPQKAFFSTKKCTPNTIVANIVIVSGDKEKDKENGAILPDVVKWGKEKKSTYAAYEHDNYRQFSEKDDVRGTLKKAGWKVMTFYEIPSNVKTMAIHPNIKEAPKQESITVIKSYPVTVEPK